MDMKRYVMLFAVLAAVIFLSGCASRSQVDGRQNSPVENYPAERSVETVFGTQIQVASPNGVAAGYVTDDPSVFMAVPDETWQFVQDNESGYFAMRAKVKDLRDIPRADLRFPTRKTALISGSYLEYLWTDERGVDINTFGIYQQGFRSVHIALINKNTYARDRNETGPIDDPLEDEEPAPPMDKSELTQGEIKEGYRYLVEVSGSYYGEVEDPDPLGSVSGEENDSQL